jgi:hypothetical protein
MFSFNDLSHILSIVQISLIYLKEKNNSELYMDIEFEVRSAHQTVKKQIKH